MSTYTVEFTPSGETFEVDPGESVLDAALRQGVQIRYGCRSGKCSTCKFQVEDGEVEYGNVSVYSLPDAERDDGWALLCQARPLSDLLIRDNRPPDQRARALLAPAAFGATVVAVRQLTAELVELRLRLERPMTFYAGQFAELGLPVGARTIWRSYSMASSPAAAGELAFVIKVIQGGAFSARIAALAAGAPVQVRGPFGSSYLRDGERPVLMCAIGSGIAPILSMLRSAAEMHDARPFAFYYGARRPQDLPYLDELRQLFQSSLASGSRFVPTLDGLQADDAWSGDAGNVTQAIQRGLPEAHPYDAYLCGAPPMCETVLRLLLAKGIGEDRVFMDRFYTTTKDDTAVEEGA